MARPVVTGVGVLLPGVAKPADLLAGALPARRRVDPALLPAGRQALGKDRATLLGLVAARTALADAGLLDDDGLRVPGRSVATVVSSNYGNLQTVCRVAEALDRQGPAGVTPLDLPGASSNVIASAVAIRFGLQGVNFMLCNGATSGLDAVGWAADVIEAGRAQRAVVVGVESADPVLERLMPDVPAARLVDSAAALVLEDPRAAADRGRRRGVAVAGHARCGDLATAVERAGGGREVGLWLSPDGAAGASPPGAPPAVACRDLAGVLAPASGALGVVQCVTAASWITDTRGRPANSPSVALAAAGGSPTDDAAAAVLVTAV
jgi:3-oxoacyl-[acyl-carrier-protein] synthase II